MTRYAVVDIGTLKVKTEIASVNRDGTLNRVYNSNNLTCFDVGLEENNGFVQERYIQETIQELKRVKQELGNHKVENFKVISTHAMRRAKNRDQIIAKIKSEIGFEVENISQQQEAELFFIAVMRTFTNTDQKYAVIDVGGGSVQVLIGTPNQLERSHMMHTGAQFLHETYIPDPHSPSSFSTQAHIDKMKEHILMELMPFKPEKGIPLIYGSSIIIDVMKQIQLPLEDHTNSTTHPYITYSPHLANFIQKVLPYTFEQREKQYQDMHKGFIWTIDKGFINAITISNYFQSPYIIPSNANIAQGLIYQLAQN